jgi:hypothetical protein
MQIPAGHAFPLISGTTRMRGGTRAPLSNSDVPRVPETTCRSDAIHGDPATLSQRAASHKDDHRKVGFVEGF